MKTGALTITPEILRLIAEIDELKGSWRTLTTLNPERLSVLKCVATIKSIGSSTRIEEAKLTGGFERRWIALPTVGGMECKGH